MKTISLALGIFLSNNAYSIDKYDYETLTEVCIFESASSNMAEKVAVIHVIFNRVEDKRFPSSVKEVIYQPYQFSYTLIENRRTPTKEEFKECKKAVSIALATKKKRHVYTHYYLNKTKYAIEEPYWAKDPKDSKQFDKHIFIRI